MLVLVPSFPKLKSIGLVEGAVIDKPLMFEVGGRQPPADLERS